jgi:hypothetical protein
MSLWTLSVLLASVVSVAAMEEPRTGIKFADKKGMAVLNRLGVRYKGPIKVYAVGEYSDGTYMLQMSYGVGAQKMTSALADALKPRCSDTKSIEAFEECLLKGLPNGAPKGTKLAFSTGGGSLRVAVNDKAVGTIGSKALTSAFADIYCDKNAVCTMVPVGEAAASTGGFLTPKRGAAIGAAVGYALGKAMS